MTKNRSVDNMAKKLFSKSEVQNRIAVNTVKMIIGDIVTLYKEFKNNEGSGALFFNPASPNNSCYMSIKDIKNDIILAEEVMDKDLKVFLEKLLNVVIKEENGDKAIVVLLDSATMSIHLVDLNTAEETINELANAFSRD
jgi:hypothetical protein